MANRVVRADCPEVASEAKARRSRWGREEARKHSRLKEHPGQSPEARRCLGSQRNTAPTHKLTFIIYLFGFLSPSPTDLTRGSVRAGLVCLSHHWVPMPNT